MAQIERGFVSVREGQVHYRHARKSSDSAAALDTPALWMLHASPASSVSLTGLMSEFSASREVFAPDTLGNGDSSPAELAEPDIAYYADSSWRAMDQLGIRQVDLYGSHTGAHVAVEMAILNPGRVRRVILDGIAMFEPAEKAEYLAHYAPAMAPDITGAQFHWALNFVRDQGWFFPYFRRDSLHNRGLAAPSAEALHRTTVEVLKALRTYHLAYRAAFAHDDRGRLPLLGVPTLCMADATDPLAKGVSLAASLVKDATPWIFYDDGEDALERKANALASFLDSGRLNAGAAPSEPQPTRTPVSDRSSSIP